VERGKSSKIVVKGNIESGKKKGSGYSVAHYPFVHGDADQLQRKTKLRKGAKKFHKRGGRRPRKGRGSGKRFSTQKQSRGGGVSHPVSRVISFLRGKKGGGQIEVTTEGRGKNKN